MPLTKQHEVHSIKPLILSPLPKPDHLMYHIHVATFLTPPVSSSKCAWQGLIGKGFGFVANQFMPCYMFLGLSLPIIQLLVNFLVVTFLEAAIFICYFGLNHTCYII